MRITTNRRPFLRGLFSWLIMLMIAFVLALLLRMYVLAPVKVDGSSMLPTYHNGERLFIEKLSKPKRFDVIVFNEPSAFGKNGHFIKRVIGLPGDALRFENGVLYVNDKMYKEPYLKKGTKTTISPDRLETTFSLQQVTGESKVPPHKYFVLGDNRNGSSDSRVFSFIDATDINGKIIQF